jgi:TatD DNase family protein
MKGSLYIDFHTHKPLYENDHTIVEILSKHKVANGTTNYHTIGHHPWWTDEPLTEQELKSLQDELIASSHCIAVGECGLDKLKGPKLGVQEQIFLQHIQLANTLLMPLVVHCVRQYDQALKMKIKYAKTPWVIHGFRRNKELAKTLIDHGVYLSVSPLLYMNTSFEEMLKYIPHDMYFLETDSEYSLSIIQRYEMMATLKKIDTFALQNQMVQNFNTFYNGRARI